MPLSLNTPNIAHRAVDVVDDGYGGVDTHGDRNYIAG